MTIDPNVEPSTGVANEQRPVLIKKVKLDSGMVTPDDWQFLDEAGYANLLLHLFSEVVGSEAASKQSIARPASTGNEPAISGKLRRTFRSLFNKAHIINWDTLQCALDDIILLSSADTGGHAEFLDMHAALINGPSFNLFFSRLTDKLDETFKVYFTDENHTSSQEEDSDSNVKEVMFQVLSSITCFGNSHCTGAPSLSENVGASGLKRALEIQHSKIMFVGTYKDKVTDDEFEKRDAEILQEVESTAFFKHVMFADHAKKQLMIKVDNQAGGEAEINEIRAILKEKIEKCFKKIPIPASWFVLSLLIRNHGHPTMSLKRCEVLAGELYIAPPELQTALWFLHHGLGVLLYYPMGELKEVIFCNLQAIYGSVTNLIKKSYIDRYVQHESFLDYFRNLGIFSLKEIEIAPDSSICRELLVKLLKHLNIITSAPLSLLPSNSDNDMYFMPCMLRCSREEVAIPQEGNPEPLMLHFKCGFTPMGVFPAMITRLFSQVNELNWKIIKQGPKRDKIFKNRVCFRVGRDIVYVSSHLRFLEIAILRKSTTDESLGSLCRLVRQVFQDTLQRVTKKMNYDFYNGHQYAFWCTCCGEKSHLAVLEEVTSDFVECLRNPEETESLNSRQRVWFSQATATHEGIATLLFQLLWSKLELAWHMNANRPACISSSPTCPTRGTSI